MAQIDNITSIDIVGNNVVIKATRRVSGMNSSTTFTFTKAEVAEFGVSKLIANVDTTLVGVPSTSTSAGVPNDIAIAAGFLYICVATNSWRRVALTTF